MAVAGTSQSVLCPKCATAAPVGARFCPECGSLLEGSTLRFPIPPDEPGMPPLPPSRRVAPRPGPALPLVVLAVGLLLMIVFGVLGLWWTEVVIVPVILVMAFMCVESAWDRMSGPLEALARRSGERLWVFGRVGRVALVTWTRAAGTHLSVWIRRVPVERRHHRALQLLGRAVYSGDDHLAQVYRSMATSTGDRLEELRRELRRARREAEADVEQERAATDSTTVFATPERDDVASMSGDRR